MPCPDIEDRRVAPRRYELVVSGEAGTILSAVFAGFEITQRPPMTVVRGDISDSAALEEVIARLHCLGLHLYEVRELSQ
jgi:hypothetical protein